MSIPGLDIDSTPHWPLEKAHKCHSDRCNKPRVVHICIGSGGYAGGRFIEVCEEHANEIIEEIKWCIQDYKDEMEKSRKRSESAKNRKPKDITIIENKKANIKKVFKK